MKYINKSRFFSLVLLLTLLFSLLISYAKSSGKAIADSVVRLHIVANSDSGLDQELKLKVRDRILNDTSHIFEKANSPYDAFNLADKNREYIKEVAKDELRKYGSLYDVSVKTGMFPFPTKVYGNIALPSGKYNAVRIEIGEGAGENWWCVMYPPLCFTEGILVAPDSATEKLKASLSPADYDLVTQNPSSKIPVEIKFKVVEIFQNIF